MSFFSLTTRSLAIALHCGSSGSFKEHVDLRMTVPRQRTIVMASAMPAEDPVASMTTSKACIKMSTGQHCTNQHCSLDRCTSFFSCALAAYKHAVKDCPALSHYSRHFMQYVGKATVCNADERFCSSMHPAQSTYQKIGIAAFMLWALYNWLLKPCTKNASQSST